VLPSLDVLLTAKAASDVGVAVSQDFALSVDVADMPFVAVGSVSVSAEKKFSGSVTRTSLSHRNESCWWKITGSWTVSSLYRPESSKQGSIL
jgi:hypothetical protein